MKNPHTLSLAPSPPYLKTNLNDLLVYFVAFCLSFWGLGTHLPGLPFGMFLIGIFALLYFSPLFIKNKLLIPNKNLVLGFVVFHWFALILNLKNPLALDFIMRINLSFCFYVLLVNIILNIRTYERFLRILMLSFALIVCLLVYKHIFIYKSLFLSTHLGDPVGVTRAGKNTLSFALGVMFPFFLARFFYNRTLLNLLCFLLIGFAMFYTLSRMVILNFFFSFALFCIFSIKQKAYIKLTFILFMILTTLAIVSGFGMKQFLKLKKPTEVQSIETGQEKFISFDSHRGHLIIAGIKGFLNSPIWGNGLSAFRNPDNKLTGGSMTHNDYIQILYELGGIGMLMFVSLFVATLSTLFKIKHAIPLDKAWIWDAHMASLFCTFFMMLFINAYDTVLVWFILAGPQILYLLYKKSETKPLASQLKPVEGS